MRIRTASSGQGSAFASCVVFVLGLREDAKSAMHACRDAASLATERVPPSQSELGRRECAGADLNEQERHTVARLIISFKWRSPRDFGPLPRERAHSLTKVVPERVAKVRFSDKKRP